MVRIVSLIPRKHGLTHEQFKDHYENRHAPLILSIFPQICRYPRNYTAGDNFHYASMQASPLPPYDVVTEIDFPSRAAFDEVMGQFASDAKKQQLIVEDEARFCDTENMVMYLVEEWVSPM